MTAVDTVEGEARELARRRGVGAEVELSSPFAPALDRRRQAQSVIVADRQIAGRHEVRYRSTHPGFVLPETVEGSGLHSRGAPAELELSPAVTQVVRGSSTGLPPNTRTGWALEAALLLSLASSQAGGSALLAQRDSAAASRSVPALLAAL